MEENWKQLLAQSITRPKQIDEKFKVDIEGLNVVVAKYPMMISKYFFDLIEEKDDPIWKQCVPDIKELQDPFGFDDPLNEEGQSHAHGLVHRYPDRALMCVSISCATYCRFCTRKRQVGIPYNNFSKEDLAEQLVYLKQTTSIRDVIVSGGDPFLLSDETIELILKKLREIPHIEIIRIGSRIPCTLPQRITSKLCNMLKKYHPLYLNIHFNHPAEITKESERACGLLADAGIPLGSQSVLLKGINEDPEIIKNLVQKLLRIRVKPYYLFQMDLVKGTYHFRTRVESGIKIINTLVGYTSGLGVPRYVIDAPGGGGKIPIQPDYIKSIDDDKIVLRNYEGKTCYYPLIPRDEPMKILTNPIISR
jgi:lysine 2,3-aminomutase